MKVFFRSMVLTLLLLTQAQAAEESAPPTVMAKPSPVIPGNEILLFDIIEQAQCDLRLSAGKNITNSPGYDSQPKFSHDGQVIFYTRAVTDVSSTQMDIYQYNLANGETKPYLSTPLSEYSPTPMPHQAGLSVVQVDDKGDQYLVFLNNELSQDKQSQRYSDLKQVGYFNWTLKNQNWSFILNDSSGGDLYHMGQDKQPSLLEKNVGRTFVTDAKHQRIFYVNKNSTPWRINSRVEKNKAEEVMPLPLGVEDFTLDSKGRFWAGRDNTLFVSTDQTRWYIVAEFTDPKLHQISRLTTNPKADKIAIVFAEKTISE